MDAIQFQISFHDLRPIALNFYELVCRKGINFLNVSIQRSTVLVSLFSNQHSTLNKLLLLLLLNEEIKVA